jgi:hypothetical protein
VTGVAMRGRALASPRYRLLCVLLNFSF